MAFFETSGLAVGYGGKVLIHDIDISLEKGAVLTFIGPNGAGKSTILKTLARRLPPLGGGAYIAGRELRAWGRKELARTMSVLLTEQPRPELMTCADVVAMGRYPYTDLMGRLTPDDRAAATAALARVHAEELAARDFAALSDGQRQRVLLARAICQEPKLLVLDEPTAYLDIRHKLELLDIIRQLARDRGTAVVMSLHELDLSLKVSDRLLCVRGGARPVFGTPEEVMRACPAEELYGLPAGAYDPLFGGVELPGPEGEPRVFVVAGGGCGAPVFRLLGRRRVPFAAGVLAENDVDCHAARRLSGRVVAVPAFFPAAEADYAAAEQLMLRCGAVIDAGTPVGPFNRVNERLLAAARARGVPVYTPEEWEAAT